ALRSERDLLDAERLAIQRERLVGRPACGAALRDELEDHGDVGMIRPERLDALFELPAFELLEMALARIEGDRRRQRWLDRRDLGHGLRRDRGLTCGSADRGALAPPRPLACRGFR